MISIIIPAYNSAAFIGETIENILSQSYSDVEIIVVNDGSTDDTSGIVSGLSEDNPGKIRLIEKENGGVSSARNLGLESAKGEFVLFQDADDLYADGALSALAEAGEACDADVFIFRLRTFTGDGPGKFNAFSDALASMESVDPFDLQLLWNFLVSNKMYRRSRLVESGVRFPASRYSEEGAFFMSYVYTLPKIAGCYPAAALYRRHTPEQGLSVSQTVSASLAKSFCDSMAIIRRRAVEATRGLPEDRRTEYLGEIDYKEAYVLVSQFYRLMWHGDEECVAFCADRISELLRIMPENRRQTMLAADFDLHLLSPCRTRAEVAKRPNVSVILRSGKGALKDFVNGIYSQLSPMFELIVPESAANSTEFPQRFRKCSNLIILPDKGFLRRAKKIAKGRRIVFRRGRKIDQRMLRLAYKLRQKLPAKLVDSFFPVLSKMISFALVKRIIK